MIRYEDKPKEPAKKEFNPFRRAADLKLAALGFSPSYLAKKPENVR